MTTEIRSKEDVSADEYSDNESYTQSHNESYTQSHNENENSNEMDFDEMLEGDWISLKDGDVRMLKFLTKRGTIDNRVSKFTGEPQNRFIWQVGAN